MNALDFSNLTHRYGDVTALDDVTFSVPEGALCGLVGPNGAGKTTLLNVAATLLVPTAGSVDVLGRDVCSHRGDVRRLVGFMPDFFGVYEDMKVWEYLDYFGAAYRLNVERRRQRIPGLLDLVHLADKHDDYVESLSRGMQQRLCLARALIHTPRVLLLDEPAAGLDARARVELRDLLRGLNAQGVSVLISSQVLSDLADICTHIVVIEQGRLVSAGLLSDLLRRAGRHVRVRIRVACDGQRAHEILSAAPGVIASSWAGDQLVVDFEGDEKATARLLRRLVRQRIDVIEFVPQRDLEAAFDAMTKGHVS